MQDRRLHARKREPAERLRASRSPGSEQSARRELVSFIGRREPGFRGRLIVVFAPDRIFRGGPNGRSGSARRGETEKQVGEVGSRKAGRSCPRFLNGRNQPGPPIKSRPGSLHGKAFFPCRTVPVFRRDRHLACDLTARAAVHVESGRRSPVARTVPAAGLEGLLGRPAISLLERFAQSGRVLLAGSASSSSARASEGE